MSTAGLVQPLTPPRRITVARPVAIATTAGVPWYIYLGVVAITSASIGGNWDVSWHRSIGRDSFLTPAHLMIYACGVLAAVLCGYLIFATTFAHSPAATRLREHSVSVLGFRAPLGAFLAAWGGIAMLTSGPFDNWWHNAYGLDVKVISPPHTLLILGIRCVGLGIVFLILAAMNREGNREAADGTAQGTAQGAAQGTAQGTADRTAQGTADRTADRTAKTPTYRSLQRLYLYLGGLMIAGNMFFVLEQVWDVKLHSASAYIALGIALPLFFALIARSSRSPWACTTSAAIYTAMGIAEILIFPLFPATPKLGPVYNQVTHLIPMKFPILILVPALTLDLLWQRTRSWKTWQIAAVSGILFTAVLVLVEWPFASFLLSKASENRFFGTIYFDYNSRPDGYDRLREWFQPSSPAAMAKGLVEAALFAAIGTWAGLRGGNWMKSVQR